MDRKRWAKNLASYRSFEIARFVRYVADKAENATKFVASGTALGIYRSAVSGVGRAGLPRGHFGFRRGGRLPAIRTRIEPRDETLAVPNFDFEVIGHQSGGVERVEIVAELQAEVEESLTLYRPAKCIIIHAAESH